MEEAKRGTPDSMRHGQPATGWDVGENGRPGHWDLDDGIGNRLRYGKDGKPLTIEEVLGIYV